MALFGKWSRRDLLKTSGGALAVAPLAAAPAAAAIALPKLTGLEADNCFTRIGVRPLINARGTYTIISGSRSLPEVKQAMFEASHYYVDLDEMMNGIGARLAALNGAEWGIVTNGCEAAIVLATIACIAGSDVEKAQALPYIKGKDQVLVPKHSRNPYDVGIRMVGAKLVEVETPDQMRSAIGPRTAMIYVMSSPREAKSPLNIAAICAIGKEKGVPVFVDAAAEEPLVPNIHLAKGATLVGYSGGKCLRGPQSSGMLIGDKSLCEAAYYQAAPHHCYGRALKCSKEESMGLLAAVEVWHRRDHDGEQRMWRSWLDHIAGRVKDLPTVQLEYLQPQDLSNRATRLRIHWDANRLGITGSEVEARLDAGTPRILVENGTGSRPGEMASTLTIMPYMMDPGEEAIVADAIHAALTNPGSHATPTAPSGAPAPVAGDWLVTVQYQRGTGEQRFVIRQDGSTLTGHHKGEIYEGDLSGTVHADQVVLKSHTPVGGNTIAWTFTGNAGANSLAGTVDMGEYGPASFTARRA
ncbi:MAG: Cys/Met metabolism pyridoxal-phosphate-dependent protein [Alphaproteobacteria bacterium 64-11]|nr:PLP-dependent transferase [Alphaproteobacteria bacterium]OJU07941.1 MAG: Cys/Met metabolism pyridoxal-phosphate-dependent protein [Alphaproteobacteria bacterium 64-11]